MLLLIHSSLFSQADNRFGLKCSFWTLFDDNAFRNYRMLSDVVYQPDVTLYYSRETDWSGFQMDYQGSWFFFQNYADRKFQLHALGLSGSRLLNDSGTVALYWGLHGGKRWNQPGYAYYDYGTASGYLNLRFDGGGKGSIGLGFSGQLQKFDELNQFDYFEIRSYLQPTLYLPTRTTLIGQFQLGYKKFIEPAVSQKIVEETITWFWNGNKWVRGKGNPNRTKQDSVRTKTITRVVTVTSPGKSVLQFTGLVRAAQSVFSGTGIAVQGLIRRNPRQNGRVLSFQDSGYEQEDVLFDDPYSYAGDEWSIEWTQLLPWKMSLKTGWDYKNKRYDIAACDAEGYPLENTKRNDRRKTLWITLKKNLKIKGFSPTPSMQFSFYYQKNGSNDAYYDYSNRVVSIGLNAGF